VGVDFFARLLQVEDGTRIKLQLWDTAGMKEQQRVHTKNAQDFKNSHPFLAVGQERFRSITKSYFRNSV
jgi:Ras-related protein Rab-39B